MPEKKQRALLDCFTFTTGQTDSLDDTIEIYLGAFYPQIGNYIVPYCTIAVSSTTILYNT